MRTKRPRIIPFAILTTLTLITWAILDVWRTFQKPVPLEVEEAALSEFDPTLPREGLSEIENRLFFSDEEARALLVAPEGTPSPEGAEGGNVQ